MDGPLWTLGLLRMGLASSGGQGLGVEEVTQERRQRRGAGTCVRKQKLGALREGKPFVNNYNTFKKPSFGPACCSSAD